jgi:hypothetical protein
MSNQKCLDCGLVNWSDATNCKRCNAPLQQFNGAVALPAVQQDRPARVLGLLMIVWGVVIFGAALFIFRVGGSVDPLLLGGPVILVSGILVMRGHSAAMGLYFLGLVGMCVWAAVTESVPVAISSFIFPGLVGLMVAKRRFPILAGFLIVLSCLAFLAPFLIASMLKPGKVAWQDFRPAQGVFTVKMPSPPIAGDPSIEHVASYTMTNHRYESPVRGQGSALYVVVDFSPALSTEKMSYEQMLDAELSEVVTRTSSTLISKRSMTVNEYPGLEFEMKPPENLGLSSPKMFGKIFMYSEHLYMMGITGSEGSALLAGKDDFLNPTLSYRSANTQPAR